MLAARQVRRRKVSSVRCRTTGETRTILTGAGTSAFIGECLAPYLAAQSLGRVEAIATTDLVSAPYLYFEPQTPTLLVSFARSGNSPESVAAVDLADQCVGAMHHLVVTCNPQGELAREVRDAPRRHDHPAAGGDARSELRHDVELQLHAGGGACGAVRHRRHAGADRSRRAGGRRRHRGAGRPDADAGADGGTSGWSISAAISSRGSRAKPRSSCSNSPTARWSSSYDSPMGFRHGPKAIVDARTLVVVFVSNDRLHPRLRSRSARTRSIATAAPAA